MYNLENNFLAYEVGYEEYAESLALKKG